ncbi:MAG: hypothetical protein KGQ66_00630 [Acidobacteriota bacterium]|nr:hypothetical protein [Acidobacteriota bacterium]
MNPFRYSDPIPVEDLVDREVERQEMIDLAWSANNARLAAPRRYGKTSLLKATLAKAADEGWTTVYVDFFGVLDLTDIASRIETAYSEQLTGRLRQWFTSLRRTLRPVARVGGGPVSLEVSTSAGPGDPLTERLNLPLRLHERDGRRVLVAFDEFQDVLTAANADAIIRSQIQHHGTAASYIFAGSQVGMMEELFADKRRAFYAQARPVALPPLSALDLGEFIAGRFTATGKDVGVGLGPLLDTAAGHPQRAMLLAHELWTVTPSGSAADEEAWVSALAVALAATREEAKTIWTHLSGAERQVLTAVAENRAGLYSTASGSSRGGSRQRAAQSLVAASEITLDPNTRTGYRVVDPLLAEWLRLGRPTQ